MSMQCPSGEIEITAAMIEAGVDEMRRFQFDEPLSRIVEAVYIAMRLEVGASGPDRTESPQGS